MEATPQTGPNRGQRRLKLVNFEIQENHISHETQGLSDKHLVVRRGKPFKVTLLFYRQMWNPKAERLALQVLLGEMSAKMLVHFSDKGSDPHSWSAQIYPGNIRQRVVTIHVCSPVLSSVAQYQLLVHIAGTHEQSSYAAGTFVLLYNPWLKEDAVYMPLDVQRQEYIKSDYGVIYMGTDVNVSLRPWSFGQYEPGVLEACLQLLQVSPQHLSNSHKDYVLRADPAYLSRIICAMVNSSDDMGLVEGRWKGSYKDGVEPTQWSGSADILHRWMASKGKPVRYGQCWVFASVLCTVMRVLGIPSRVVTVFNAAHDGDGNLITEEFYSSTGERLGLSKDSIWNFHVWVECWMKRSDIGAEFDGWQVVDPTPQEMSGGAYRCGPCPVVAIQRRYLGTPYDTAFVYASVDADIVRMIVRSGKVVGKKVDTKWVGRLIFTKSIGSDVPVDLTDSYKRQKQDQTYRVGNSVCRASRSVGPHPVEEMVCLSDMPRPPIEDTSSLDVTLTVQGEPTAGKSINLTVTITNLTNSTRLLREHLNAQLKEFNSGPEKSFWKSHQEVRIQPFGDLTQNHFIPLSKYEAFLVGDDIVKVVAVIKDLKTKERVLAIQDFNLISPKINIKVEGGDSIQLKKEHTAIVSFTNKLNKPINGAVLTVEGYGLLQGKQEARLTVLHPDEKIEKKVAIMASTSGTKLLSASFSHSSSSNVVSRTFHKVSVTT
ncbi:protein-glutamine gamma-glutamyltransferase 5-like isoform X1 [Hippocampus zosterae]|uniref:protein-glutamine gamma-glutamyltransferase 5-like isoform X1 n=2 Tax=Hippocampus zosterae TaxID=109293 RepID=UPI00223DE0D1|nr:protein-glutamine gamma-glutamyltransferase 5-like isoform X1 [Hippocampus zosterae]